ncbi:hypothetical protein J7894_01420 [Mycoplasmopsis agalactiae]|nr:hypothetical protein [Mycoplasmopsis agalactiae]MCE6090744.1 hypothetical protein [Mycoplasmopsis agalactiae]
MLISIIKFLHKLLNIAWDPDKNPDQKQLISKFCLIKKGSTPLDNKKKEILTLIDTFIDQLTGTKKEI